MANQKLTQQTELTAATADDLLYIVDNPGGTPVSRKISKSNLLKTILPAADSTTALQLQNAAGTTLLALDTTNNKLDVTEGVSLSMNNAMSAEGKYSGWTVEGIAGAYLGMGTLVYLDPTDSRWEQTDANIAAGADGDPRGILGICVKEAFADGDATRILLWGLVRADTNFPTFTINAPVYVSENVGEVTVTQPTTGDVVIRVIGFGFDANTLYFCPSPDYITHT